MDEFLRCAGIAVILVALLGPITHCAYKEKTARTIAQKDLRVACIKAKGEWRKHDTFSPYTCIQNTAESKEIEQ